MIYPFKDFCVEKNRITILLFYRFNEESLKKKAQIGIIFFVFFLKAYFSKLKTIGYNFSFTERWYVPTIIFLKYHFFLLDF